MSIINKNGFIIVNNDLLENFKNYLEDINLEKGLINLDLATFHGSMGKLIKHNLEVYLGNNYTISLFKEYMGFTIKVSDKETLLGTLKCYLKMHSNSYINSLNGMEYDIVPSVTNLTNLLQYERTDCFVF